MRDVFEEGYVDMAIFQSTYLKYWYTERLQHRRAERALLETAPRQVHRRTAASTRATARPGSRQLEEDARPLGPQGRQALHRRVARERLPRLEADRPESYRFLEKCQELGIKNIHAHKGPTIWPLNKDAFSMERRRPDRRPTSRT